MDLHKLGFVFEYNYKYFRDNSSEAPNGDPFIR